MPEQRAPPPRRARTIDAPRRRNRPVHRSRYSVAGRVEAACAVEKQSPRAGAVTMRARVGALVAAGLIAAAGLTSCSGGKTVTQTVTAPTTSAPTPTSRHARHVSLPAFTSYTATSYTAKLPDG